MANTRPDPIEKTDTAEKADPLTPHGGFADLVGYRIGDWESGHAEVILDVEARHLNRSGVAHGGVMSTLIDAACGYSGCYCTVPGNARRAMTLQLTTQFLGQVRHGDTLTATGRVVGGGRSVFFADCEVRTAKGELVGRGEGVFKYRRGSETPEGLPARQTHG
ncbi:PaaI family thioesterase [Ferruginivarius sediminum]|uniref:PaaI family thioesterase n=2 Tax=Ferruginivarius sediminum TaxID=2661937 RepID=A0A369TEJ1_9PROT|nr:PaaI family thioesterase [Ferruginivarius sediminum]